MAPWFAEDEPHPFVRFPVHYSIITEDKFGNYLFSDGSEIVRVPRRQAQSPLTLTLEKLTEDSVCIHIAGANGQPVRVRLGEQPWSWWGKSDRAEFKSLPPGDYQFEAEIQNEYLEISTQQMEFTIKGDAPETSAFSAPNTPSIPNIPISEAVEKLFSKNWNERNEAVKSLAQFPEQARELLKKIDSDQLNEINRWWLDAALQQVEEKK